jgi:AhpD family alkylhydroperoxidase
MRVDLYKPWPAGYKAMLTMQSTLDEAGLDPILVELLKTRVSQINACAYCLDMHTKDALALGESPQRLFALSAWRETDFFTDRERAALALAESITLLSQTHVPDDVVDGAGAHFSPEELAQLVFQIIQINSWNRLAVTSRLPVGGYVSRHGKADG